MPLRPHKTITPPLLTRETPNGLGHDITWNRPVFHPPMLPNLRVIFDPLPFTVTRAPAGLQRSARR